MENKKEDLTNEEKLQKLEIYLEGKRNEWTGKIRQIIGGLKRLEGLEDSLVSMLSYRQIMVDEMASLQNTIYDKEKSLSRLEKHKYISYYNSDYKLTDKQKNMMMRADLADEHKQIGLLKSQLSFYQEGIQTLDKMGWAAKIRVDIDR